MTIVMNEASRGNSKPDGGSNTDVDLDFDFENNVEFQAWLKNYLSQHQSQYSYNTNINKVTNTNISNSLSNSNAIATGGSAISSSTGGNASVNVDVDFDPLVQYLQRYHVAQMYGHGDWVFNTPGTISTISGQGYLQGTEGSDYMTGDILDTSVVVGAESGDILTGGGSLIGGKGQDLLIGQGATYFEVQGGDMILGWELGSAIGFSKPLGAGDDLVAINGYALFDGDRVAGAQILRNGYTTAFVAGVEATALSFI